MMKWWIRKIVAGIMFFAAATLLLSLVVMLLWNTLIPGLFHGPSLTFAQALGLLVLSHILLRGFSPWHHGNGWRRDRWKRRFAEKLATMSPEEQARLREAWHRRCGGAPDEAPKSSV